MRQGTRPTVAFLFLLLVTAEGFLVGRGGSSPLVRIRPPRQQRAFSPSSRNLQVIDDVLDFLEQKAGLVGFTEADLESAGSESDGDKAAKELEQIFEREERDIDESTTNVFIFFIGLLPILGMAGFRFLIPDTLNTLNI